MYNPEQAPTQINRMDTSMISQKSSKQQQPIRRSMGTIRLATVLVCSFCLFACLLPARPVHCGRLQDFFQNLVGGGSSSNNSNNNSNSNNNANSNSNSNSNSNNDSNDSDTAASSDSNSDQPLTPMMSAMNPFMRYPSFYDSFGPANYGGFPGMSFSNPMSAMSGLSPMASMSSNSLSGAFSPASFGPASFGSFGSSSFGSSSANPLGSFGGSNGMSASSLNNVYATQPNLMGGYTPYYGRRR